MWNRSTSLISMYDALYISYKKHHQHRASVEAPTFFFSLGTHTIASFSFSENPEGCSRSWRWETHPVRAGGIQTGIPDPRNGTLPPLKTTREARMVVWKMMYDLHMIYTCIYTYMYTYMIYIYIHTYLYIYCVTSSDIPSHLILMVIFRFHFVNFQRE